MAGETVLHVVGNMTADPDLRVLDSGDAVASFTVASTPRYRDNATGEWQERDALFLRCTAWRKLAENVADSFHRGDRVIVIGRLNQRSYTTDEGEKRTVYELDVTDVGASAAFGVVRAAPRRALPSQEDAAAAKHRPAPAPAAASAEAPF